MSTPLSDTTSPELPSLVQCLMAILLHALILGICTISLFALWVRAPKATFAVFLVWTIAFYVVLVILAWNGRPRKSILSVLVGTIKVAAKHRSRTQELPQSPTPGPPSRPLSTIMHDQDTYPPEPRGPYRYHQPAYRRVASSGHEDEVGSSNTHGFPLSVENDYDDEDEETQQRRIEQEMDRREVSIITVPKRKLWITNPS